MRTVFRAVLKWATVLFATILVVAVIGDPYWMEIPFTLVFGWIRFLRDNIAAMEANPLLLAEAAVCVALLGLGGHWFARWLHGQMVPGSPVAWRPGWTIAGLGGILLLFVAGIAIVGITHQTAWLFTAKGPLLEDPWTDRARVSEALLLASGARNAVADTFEKAGRPPATDAEAGWTAPPKLPRRVQSVAVGPGGVVSIEMSEAIAGGGVITLTPKPEGGVLKWTCRSTLPRRILPSDCRNPTGEGR